MYKRQPYGYSYDNIGNRKTAQDPAQELAYAANELNQYTRIEENAEAPFAPQYDASGHQTLIRPSTGIWTVAYLSLIHISMCIRDSPLPHSGGRGGRRHA